jgi:hypothetical protein
MREYTVSDLFFTRWEDLSARVHSEVYALYNSLAGPENPQYGFILIQILRRLRKNKRLVNKIDVAQAVDIFNDLAFFKEPWYNFPALENKKLALLPPDEKLARSSFDQFIYADNEFSSYLVKQDPNFLNRLVVTLYPLLGDECFDPETVEARAEAITGQLAPWQLNQVFFTFAQVRAHVMDRCKTLLPKAPVADTTEAPTATGPMWHRIKHQAARTLVFGTFQQTGRANMYSVLDHLEILCQEQANAKSKTN